MEILILTCLLIIIVLLAKDIRFVKGTKQNKEQLPSANPKLPDIMGAPKIKERHCTPIEATKRQIGEHETIADTFEKEIDDTDVEIQIPQEELDEVFDSVPDWEEEEEEWSRYAVANGYDGFATGVTFEELSTVGMLLQQKGLEPSQQKEAVELVHRIQGTDLYSLLENSIDGASQKIAELLDRSLPIAEDSSSSNLRKNEIDGFDIGEFV